MFSAEQRQNILQIAETVDTYAEVGSPASYILCLNTLAELPDEVFASSVNLRIIVHGKLAEYIEHPMLCLQLRAIQPLLNKFLDTMYIHPLFEEDDDDEDILESIVFWNSAMKDLLIQVPRAGQFRLCYKNKHSEWMTATGTLKITTTLDPEIVTAAMTLEYSDGDMKPVVLAEHTYFS